MSWDDKLLKQAKKIIKLYPQKRSALGPLLHLAQSKDGYISDDSITVKSELVGITEVQVKSVSTFYSMYKQEPTGKYLLSVCKSISCTDTRCPNNSNPCLLALPTTPNPTIPIFIAHLPPQ